MRGTGGGGVWVPRRCMWWGTGAAHAGLAPGLEVYCSQPVMLRVARAVGWFGSMPGGLPLGMVPARVRSGQTISVLAPDDGTVACGCAALELGVLQVTRNAGMNPHEARVTACALTNPSFGLYAVILHPLDAPCRRVWLYMLCVLAAVAVVLLGCSFGYVRACVWTHVALHKLHVWICTNDTYPINTG